MPEKAWRRALPFGRELPSAGPHRYHAPVNGGDVARAETPLEPIAGMA